MDWLFPSFDASKFKPACKMAVQRIHIVSVVREEFQESFAMPCSAQHKNSEMAKMRAIKKEIATLLLSAVEKPGSLELALIKVEGIVRKDHEIQAMEVLALMCELLHERTTQIKSCSKEAPPEELLEAMQTVVWSSARVGVAELRTVKEQLGLKFGPEFISQAAGCKAGSRVNEKIKYRLSIPTPSLEQKVHYLEAIVADGKIDVNIPELMSTTESVLGAAVLGPKDEAASASSSASSYPATSAPATYPSGGFPSDGGLPTPPAVPGYPASVVPPAASHGYPSSGPPPAVSHGYPSSGPPPAAVSMPPPPSAAASMPPPPASGGASLEELQKRFAALSGGLPPSKPPGGDDDDHSTHQL
jgi:hypothetical protein